MTNQELSNEFDSLINTYSTQQSFGIAQTTLQFDEYEKSVFLTKAQEQIIVNLYNGKLTGDSFEKTEELRRYLSSLVKTYSTSDKVELDIGLSENSVFFKLPSDIYFITYEAAITDDEKLKCLNGTILEVVPTTQDDFHKTKENPFRRPNKRRALRLDVEGGIVEIISDYNVSEYKLRYVSKPSPIILINLPKDLSIEGKTQETECKLNPAIHRVILEMAVQLALQSRAGK